MKATDIIEALRAGLSAPGGRHLYGVLGSYQQLESFAELLQQAKTPSGSPFPAPVNVNRGILDAIPDEEFRRLVEDEAKRPEPTAAHVAKAFETFLRSSLTTLRSPLPAPRLLVLSGLEMIFAYNVELSVLRTMATDEDRVLLLLPGCREGGRVRMFPDWPDASFALPTNLIADNHLWELTGS